MDAREPVRKRRRCDRARVHARHQRHWVLRACPQVTGRTPLHYAVKYEQWQVLPLLLELHADINAADSVR